jgi:flagellin
MSRINTNVSSLIAQRVLANNNDALNTSLERLSTGLKINSGADDPAGLIAAQSLKSEGAGITQAIDNAGRANNIIGTAEGGLGEVSDLLTQLQSLVNQSANTGGLSPEEVGANQLQVDSILSTINRLAQSTSFQGTKLLNGNFSYTTSGVQSTQIDDLQINSAHIPDGTSVNVVVQVTQSAQTGEITYSHGTLTSGVTLEIAGNNGTQQLSFASGTAVSSIATAINAVSTATGVSATVTGGNLDFNSTGYGSSAFVSVKTVAGTFDTDNNATKKTGRDASVIVNGAAAQSDGTTISYRSNDLDVQFDLNSAFNKPGTGTFDITGGGATFSLGSKVTETDKASIGIQSVSTGSLGNTTLGYLSSLQSGQANNLSSGNLVNAQKIVDLAVTQVSQLRGRLGAFQKFTIGSTINSLGVAFENNQAATSAIEDTDFAQETANLTRAQILSQSATTVLSQANAAPQAVLNLLR